MGFSGKMSKFPEAAEGQRSGRAPERSNFTQACNLLSQLLKEKRGSGALSLGTAGKMESICTFSGFPLSILLFGVWIFGFGPYSIGHVCVIVSCPPSVRSFSRIRDMRSSVLGTVLFVIFASLG